MWLRCLCWFPYRALKMTQKQADLQIWETFRLCIEPSHFTSDHSFSLFCCVLQQQWCISMFPDHILGNFSFCPKSSKMRIPECLVQVSVSSIYSSQVLAHTVCMKHDPKLLNVQISCYRQGFSLHYEFMGPAQNITYEQENSQAVPQTVKHRNSTWPSNSTPGYVYQRIESCSQILIHKCWQQHNSP